MKKDIDEIRKGCKSNDARTISSSDSSLSSSFGGSSTGATAESDGAAVAAEPAAGAPPPEPTFDKSSLTFLPSRALARRVAQIGSTSTFAADVKAIILSA